MSKDIGKSAVKVGFLGAGLAIGGLAMDELFGGDLFKSGDPPPPT